MVARSRNTEIVKVKVNKTMSTILPFIRIIYLNNKTMNFGVLTGWKLKRVYLAISFSVVAYFALRG